MSTSELGQKMRATFEASLPDEDVLLRRVVAQRALRVEGQQRGEGRDVGAFSPMASLLRAASRYRLSLGVGVGGLALAVIVVLFWSSTEGERMPITPSLARDLELASRGPRTTPTAPTAASASEPTDGRPALDESPKFLPSKTHPTNSDVKRRADGLGEAALGPTGSTQAETDARWARVTEAMRKQDWEAAQGALAPLIDSPDPETRDGARLVRIRLELSAGGGKDLEPRWLTDLSELAASGSTSSIRASARRLLETVRTDPTTSGDSRAAPSGSTLGNE